jgi:hypothetical protein
LVALTRFASEIHLNGRQFEFLYSLPKKLKESISDATYNAEPRRCQTRERLVEWVNHVLLSCREIPRKYPGAHNRRIQEAGIQLSFNFVNYVALIFASLVGMTIAEVANSETPLLQ